MTNRISDEEREQFRAAMQGATRQVPTNRLPPTQSLPPPEPRQTRADEQAVLAEMMSDPDPESFESGDTLSWQRPGLQNTVFRKLRRGSYRVEAEVDLHGLKSEAAALEVRSFLDDCQQRDYRCVRIIHGKGLRSPNSGPVIKSKVGGWLRKRADVLAYVSARPVDGGTGAIYVLLRAART
ncbi:MAG: Smr/MutS family protein [Pseudomonadota bacterium]